MLAVFFPLVQARWMRTLTISGDVRTGSWSGTLLEANQTAEGFCNSTPGDSGKADLKSDKCDPNAVFGVKGVICITNKGDEATNNLSLAGQVEMKDLTGQYTGVKGAILNIPVAKSLNPHDTTCFDYRLPFTPGRLQDYRLNTAVTITNQQDWLPGGKNCPGQGLCPNGPRPVTVFSLANLLSQVSSPTATVQSTPTLLSFPTGTPSPTFISTIPATPSPTDAPTEMATPTPSATPTLPDAPPTPTLKSTLIPIETLSPSPIPTDTPLPDTSTPADTPAP
jgi:hypothetical protein